MYLKNGKYDYILVDKVYVPNNSFDIGIMKISMLQNYTLISEFSKIANNNRSFTKISEKDLGNIFKPIKINRNKIKVEDDVYSIGFCYFDYVDILEFNMPFVHVSNFFQIYSSNNKERNNIKKSLFG